MKRKYIIGIMALLLLFGAWYGYHEYNRKIVPTSDLKAELFVSAEEFIQSFEKDEAAANQKFLGKIVAVNGTIKSMDSAAGRISAIILGDPSAMSAVRCLLDSSSSQRIPPLDKGKPTQLKGYCIGATIDPLLGTDVVLERCVIEPPQ
ncbi:OB-fold putative lipoprotein [Flavihumibacter rivuli]|uniref:OB-fold putative lipoprotein n=1 Tax=Flavihumibacter rivuli TaxID=2838156 RepID=UPI001BDF2247|nr:OB-fold putative lipoprotein [Flavihumibacter rivuli]ULQ55129.1 OB-fold putative lipoprotein [Flavihumibacter rivuli]